MKPNFDAVLSALRSLNQADMKVSDLKIFDDGKISLRVASANTSIKEMVTNALNKLAGVTEINLTVEKPVAGPNAPAGATAGMKQNGIPGVSHIIAVSSGKGGVGKSTTSVNLAVSLALEGAKVGLLDADIYGPNIPTMMGVTENPKLFMDPEKGEMFVPPVSHGVKVMSMGFLIQGDQPVIWRGPMLHNILNQFCTRVDWGQLDYLILDLPPGTGDVQLSLAQMIPLSGAVLVTTPQEVALQDVRKAYNMWEKVKVPVLGVVENMSYFTGDDGKQYHIFGQGGGDMLAKKFNTKLLAQMPLVPAVREGGDEGRPIVTRDGLTGVALETSVKYRSLARKIAQEIALSGPDQAKPSLEIGQF